MPALDGRVRARPTYAARAGRRVRQRAVCRSALQFGWFFFVVVTAATGYYTAVIGWVLYYAVGQLASSFAHSVRRVRRCCRPITASSLQSFVLQMICTGGRDPRLRARADQGPAQRHRAREQGRCCRCCSSTLLVLIARRSRCRARWPACAGTSSSSASPISRQRDGRRDRPRDLLAVARRHVHGRRTARISARRRSSRAPAIWTVIGDTGSALLAGLAVIPAVFALGLEPTSGPGADLRDAAEGVRRDSRRLALRLSVLRRAVRRGLSVRRRRVRGARRRAHRQHAPHARRAPCGDVASRCSCCRIPPTINNAIFVPWDLTFGSGCRRSARWSPCSRVGVVRRPLGGARGACRRAARRRFRAGCSTGFASAFPSLILTVGIWWLLTSVLGVVHSAG